MDDLWLVWALEALVLLSAVAASRWRLKALVSTPLSIAAGTALLHHRWGGPGPHGPALLALERLYPGAADLPLFVGFLAVAWLVGLRVRRRPVWLAALVAWGGCLVYLEGPLNKG